MEDAPTMGTIQKNIIARALEGFTKAGQLIQTAHDGCGFCPYSLGSIEGLAWMRGWETFHRMRAEDNLPTWWFTGIPEAF